MTATRSRGERALGVRGSVPRRTCGAALSPRPLQPIGNHMHDRAWLSKYRRNSHGNHLVDGAMLAVDQHEARAHGLHLRSDLVRCEALSANLPPYPPKRVYTQFAC
jgi:hypothetical protein